MKLSLIIPVYNERRWLVPFWERLKHLPVEQLPQFENIELIVVNDGSTDGSRELLEKLCSAPLKFKNSTVSTVKLLHHEKNQGKGAAIQTGLTVSTGNIVVIQDSDLEYSPKDLPTLLRPFFENGADAVLGSRFVGHPRRALYFWHSLWNHFVSLFSNMLININLTDVMTGYKALRGDAVRTFNLKSKRFGIEFELVSKMANANLKIFEVPISYQGRTYAEGKKIGKKDGISILFQIVRFALFDKEPYKPGLRQTLTALGKVNQELYCPLLQDALKHVALPQENCEILEVGSGIGALTEELLSYGKVYGTDLSPDFVAHLKEKFSDFPQFEGRVWDATTDLWQKGKRFDLILASNVLEHIEADVDTLKKWHNLLKPGGYLILIVPQYEILYSAIDKAVGHYCRYNKTSLSNKLQLSSFKQTTFLNGNALGIAGWIVTSCLLKKANLSSGSLKLYTLLKPAVRLLEKCLQRHVGLSLISISQRDHSSIQRPAQGKPYSLTAENEPCLSVSP